MMPPLLYMCSGLARPADQSMLAQDVETTGQTMGHGEKNKTQ